MNLCDSCHQENVLQCMRNLLEKENLEVQEFKLEKDEEEPAMTVADTRIYDVYEGDSEEQEEQEWTCYYLVLSCCVKCQSILLVKFDCRC